MGFDFVDTVAESVHGVYSVDADDIRVTGLATNCIICDSMIKLKGYGLCPMVCDDCKKAIKQIKTMPCVVNRYSTQE